MYCQKAEKYETFISFTKVHTFALKVEILVLNDKDLFFSIICVNNIIFLPKLDKHYQFCAKNRQNTLKFSFQPSK